MFNLSFLGQLLLYSALATAFLQGLVPFLGYWRQNRHALALARPFALLQSLLIANAFLLLVSAFLSNDFSLAYVAQNSHPSLPFFYRLTAVWGAHEGSFLLWIFLLDVWTAALCFFTARWQTEIRSLTLALLGGISFCFLVFLTLTSNPFKTAVAAVPQDLNPLLQDPGFFIHPPMLYTGYVGFSVVFAITTACLLYGNASLWASLVRPWALAAWSFLTIGISLGSWWAYHVLGWGGFWFWDPVENASLLPWLTGAALIHIVIVVEKQQRFSDWGFILAILTFSLSILGTFLVRSGVLISVHSFATDPSRGLFLLVLLAFITGSAMSLYLFRRKKIKPAREKFISWTTREEILLVQSIFLFIAMATVLLGTLYPLLVEALGLGTLSVGPPYFNHVLFPLLLLCLAVMGWAPLSQWRTEQRKTFLRYTRRHFAVSIVLAIALSLFFTRHWSSMLILNLSLVFWVLLSIRNTFFRQAGMTLAHAGFAIFILSIILSSTFSKERELELQTGESVTLGPYVFHFIDVEGVTGPNFKGVRANFTVLRNHRFITQLRPEKRIFTVRDLVMTKIDIYPGVFHDLYIALGEPRAEDRWSLRLYYKPFIRWIWFGGFCIALGGFLALLRRRTPDE